MKAMILVLALGLFAPSMFTQQQAGAGWDRVKWGSTLAQVVASYKAEGATVKINSVPQQYVVIPHYAVGDDSFAVNFHFNSAGLEQVIFAPERGYYGEGGKRDPSILFALPQLASRIANALQAKYGKPTYLHRGPGAGIDAQWIVAGGTIQLLLTDDEAYNFVWLLTYKGSSKAVTDRL